MASISDYYTALGQLGSGTYSSVPSSQMYTSALTPRYASAIGVPTMPSYDMAAGYGMDNIDVGGGWNPASAPSLAKTGGIGDWLRDVGVLSTRDQQGWGGLALGAAQGLGSMYMGMKQYGLAKDAYEESKNQFRLNFNNQVADYNTRLEDRQASRLNSLGGAASPYQSVSDYMAANELKRV